MCFGFPPKEATNDKTAQAKSRTLNCRRPVGTGQEPAHISLPLFLTQRREESKDAKRTHECFFAAFACFAPLRFVVNAMTFATVSVLSFIASADARFMELVVTPRPRK
jgi:hypothetical protein